MASKDRVPNARSAIDGADPCVVEILERTIYDRVTEGLHEIVHRAVTSAIVAVAGDQTPASKAIRRPTSGGQCAKVWDILDEMFGKGQIPTLQEIKKLARRRRWNENNTRIEYYRWRGAHGIHRNSNGAQA